MTTANCPIQMETSLDHAESGSEFYGYTVSGEVIEGMEVVYRIEQTDVGAVGEQRHVPLQPVAIEKVTVID